MEGDGELASTCLMSGWQDTECKGEEIPCAKAQKLELSWLWHHRWMGQYFENSVQLGQIVKSFICHVQILYCWCWGYLKEL